MNEQPTKPFSLLRWTLLTWLGWFIGILVIVGLAAIGELLGAGEESGSQAVVGVGMGIGVGLMQWVALRNYINCGLNWFWYSIIGFTAAYIGMDILGIYYDLKPETSLPFATGAGALISGWLQFYFILKNISNKAMEWIGYNFIAWVAAHLITTSFMLLKLDLPRYVLIPFAVISLTTGGPLLGYITGISMRRILRKN